MKISQIDLNFFKINISELRARVCVFVCLRPSTVKGSSVWIRWYTREQIDDVMLQTSISCAKSLHHYFRLQQSLTFITCHCILFAHQKRALVYVSLSEHGAFFTIQQASPSVCTTSKSDLLSDLSLTTHKRGRNLTRKG